MFDAIGAAIRGQNGAATKYAPAVMAATILALQWDAGLKVRALLLENGMLAFNYLEGCRSAIGGKVSQSFVVDENGHASADARPWKDVRTEVRTVYPHSSLKAVGHHEHRVLVQRLLESPVGERVREPERCGGCDPAVRLVQRASHRERDIVRQLQDQEVRGGSLRVQ